MQAAQKTGIPGIAYGQYDQLLKNQFLIATYAPPYQKAGVVPSLRIAACSRHFMTAREFFVIGASNFWRMHCIKRLCAFKKIDLTRKSA